MPASADDAFHARGRRDFQEQLELRGLVAAEFEKLDSRCDCFCNPSGLPGKFVLWVRKRRLRNRILEQLDSDNSFFQGSRHAAEGGSFPSTLLFRAHHPNTATFGSHQVAVFAILIEQ